MSLEAKKSLGQNFLKSQKAIYTMIDIPQISNEDVVVEIGPGKGALTGPLLETGATVIAFELDKRMIDFLSHKFEEYITAGTLQLVHQDVLDVTIHEYTQGKPYKVVANIPYYITNLILRTFLSGDCQPVSMCLLMQKEVAKRIVTHDNKESILSLSVKLYGTPKYLMKVGRQYFSPSPNVDSAILFINNISRNAIRSDVFEQNFFTLVKTAFAQKRKQAIKNLQVIRERSFWEGVFKELSINSSIRAEDIQYTKWLEIVDRFDEKDFT